MLVELSSSTIEEDEDDELELGLLIETTDGCSLSDFVISDPATLDDFCTLLHIEVKSRGIARFFPMDEMLFCGFVCFPENSTAILDTFIVGFSFNLSGVSSFIPWSSLHAFLSLF